MKKLATLALAGAASALALSATAASAQPYPGRYDDHRYDYRYDDRHDRRYDDRGWMSIDQRQRQLERRIEQGVRRGELTHAEARRLHWEMRQLARLEARYRVNGLSRWEMADLDRRFDRLAAQIRWERRDQQYGYGYHR